VSLKIRAGPIMRETPVAGKQTRQDPRSDHELVKKLPGFMAGDS
jgi:hypothetical protein